MPGRPDEPAYRGVNPSPLPKSASWRNNTIVCIRFRSGASKENLVQAGEDVALSCSSASEDVVAVLIQHQHQIRTADLPSLAQFDSKRLGLTYRKFGARKSVSILIGEYFRTVQDMEEISHHLPIIQAAQVSSDK
jgi:hypothetical protein